MKKKIENGLDFVTDGIEKVSSPASRAGNTVERVGKMLDDGVSSKVIALQMTENSFNSQEYTEEDVAACGKVYKDAKTRVLVTAKQARGLSRDQKECVADANEGEEYELAPAHA